MGPRRAYARGMEFNRRNDDTAPRASVEALDRARADAEAGRTVAADIVMARLREAIAAWPAARAAREDEPAPP